MPNCKLKIDPQITPVPSPGATPVKYGGSFNGAGGAGGAGADYADLNDIENLAYGY